MIATGQCRIATDSNVLSEAYPRAASFNFYARQRQDRLGPTFQTALDHFSARQLGPSSVSPDIVAAVRGASTAIDISLADRLLSPELNRSTAPQYSNHRPTNRRTCRRHASQFICHYQTSGPTRLTTFASVYALGRTALNHTTYQTPVILKCGPATSMSI